MKPIRKEYNNLIYNDDFTCCLGMARETDKIILHENTKEIFGQEGNHFHKYVTEIIVNDKLERINPGALDRCNIKKIDLSNTKVTRLNPDTFTKCMALKEIILPKNLETICSYAFADCIMLSSPVLPNSLIKINSDAFKNTRFSTLTLPKNLEYVGPIVKSSSINKIYYSKLEKSVFQSILKEINESKNCQLIGQNLESLINDDKSFKEINKIIKDNEPTI